MDQKKLQPKSKLHHSLSFNQNQNINAEIDYKELYQYERNLRISLEKQLEIQKIKVKKLLGGKLKGKICQKCLQEIKQKEEDQNKIVQNLKEFSSKMASTIIKKQQQQVYIQASTISHPSILNQKSDHVSILENFTIFGLPDQNTGSNVPKSSQQLNGQILYSLKPPNQTQQQAAHFIFPAGVAVKNLSGSKAKDKTIQIMSFCYTNLKSFVLSFKAPQMKFPNQNYNQNSILKLVNKQKNLFFICIGIRDYTWVDTKSNKLAISLDQIQQASSVNPSQNSDKQVQSQSGGSQKNQFGSNNSSFKSLEESNYQISLSQRVFCISSYFPFFTFFQQILRSLINNIKMQRLHIYKMNSQDIITTIKQTDSRYQLKRICQLFEKTMSQILIKKMYEDRLYEIKLINQQKITLLTSKHNAKTYFADQWIFAIMNMFGLDNFMDLWTEIILEEGKGVVFVCDNSHILTYTVYLFGNILVKPFNYAYPIVNIVPQDQDFLDTPFPVIYGMFKKRKYVQQNQIVERYNDRTYVFLNPDKIQIIYSAQSKKNVQKRKPSKLKNSLAPLFNQLKKHRKKQVKTTKYQIQISQYSILATQQEKQTALKIVSKVNDFVSRQVLEKIPPKNQIYNLRKKIQLAQIPQQKTPQTYLISIVVEKIKKNGKDPFMQRFLETQMFSNHLLEEAEID